MKKILMLVPALLLASCSTVKPASSDATSPTTSTTTTTTSAPTVEAAPQFPDLAGRWNLEIFGRASESDLGTPNLKGVITLSAEGAGKVGGEYQAGVRPDEFQAKPGDTRRITYRVDSGFWRASKEWDSTKSVWVSNEQLSFQLRPTRLELGGVAQEDGFPVNLQCSLYTNSRVEKPVSGKTTYTVTCLAGSKRVQLNGWLERL